MIKTSILAPSLVALVAGAALSLPAFAGDAAKKKAPAADSKAAAAPAVRDWAEVDSNGDGLISPEEMERYLAAKPGPLARK